MWVGATEVEWERATEVERERATEVERARGNWSAGGADPEREEAGSGAGAAWSGHGGGMLNALWETEGLQAVGIVVLVCASLKLLHLLGLINFSEGKRQ